MRLPWGDHAIRDSAVLDHTVGFLRDDDVAVFIRHVDERLALFEAHSPGIHVAVQNPVEGGIRLHG